MNPLTPPPPSTVDVIASLGRTIPCGLAAVLCLAAMAVPARSATFFDSRASYVAAHGSLNDVTFDGLAPDGGFHVFPNPLVLGGVTISSPQNQVVDASFLGAAVDTLFVDVLNATTTFTFDQPRTAVGFTLANFGIFGEDLITARVFNGATTLATHTFSVADVSEFTGFFGIDGVGPITSVELKPADRELPDFLVVGEVLSAGSVPEPSAWVLMIAGFGLAGLCLRRRREPARAA